MPLCIHHAAVLFAVAAASACPRGGDDGGSGGVGGGLVVDRHVESVACNYAGDEREAEFKSARRSELEACEAFAEAECALPCGGAGSACLGDRFLIACSVASCDQRPIEEIAERAELSWCGAASIHCVGGEQDGWDMDSVCYGRVSGDEPLRETPIEENTMGVRDVVVDGNLAGALASGDAAVLEAWDDPFLLATNMRLTVPIDDGSRVATFHFHMLGRLLEDERDLDVPIGVSEPVDQTQDDHDPIFVGAFVDDGTGNTEYAYTGRLTAHSDDDGHHVAVVADLDAGPATVSLTVPRR